MSEIERALLPLVDDPLRLRQAVSEYFEVPSATTCVPSKTDDIVKHIEALWPQLTREADRPRLQGDSLIPLPHSYIVPGGRFREVYYWDSYFTMLGLVDNPDQRWLVGSMADNFAHLIERYGFVPNGNRNYYLSRSQPPVFSLIVELLAKDDETAYAKYLPTLRKEYDYWMSGASAEEAGASCTTVRVGDVVMNRYWDALNEPRPESYREDLEIAEHVRERQARAFPEAADAYGAHWATPQVYGHLRAAAASGWDFSSRWCEVPCDLSTIRTLTVLPVDLNCMMYSMECSLERAYASAGRQDEARRFAAISARRLAMIQKLFWNPQTGFFHDYDLTTGTLRPGITAAGLMPLYVGAATSDQAAQCAATAELLLLKDGGIVTSTVKSGQQWDAPNGWAPLQWIAVRGLHRYGHEDLAKSVATRWLSLVEKVFRETGKLLEKYNVEECGLPGGGGEYPNQDGFGWTNGTYIALRALYGTQTTPMPVRELTPDLAY